MTLVLALVSRRFCLEVSDRLVTTAGRVFDAASNKTVLFLGLNCSVTISYTGLAYLEGMNTDQWIVERITQQSLNSNGRPSALQGFPATRQSRFLGLTVASLTSALNQVFASPGQRREKTVIPFELLLSGWHWGKRRRLRPVHVEIMKPAGATSFVVRWSRRVYSPANLTISAMGERLTSTERDQMLASAAMSKTRDDAEQALINTIRRVSSRAQTVGSDCMSIHVLLPGHEPSIVRYHPSTPFFYSQESDGGGRPRSAVPAVYSPWILSSTFVHGPSIVVGQFVLTIDGRKVRIEAPTPPPGGIRSALIPVERTTAA